MFTTLSTCCTPSQPKKLLSDILPKCISNNWNLPSIQQINILVSIINNSYQQLQGQSILNTIFANLQKCQHSLNIPFILKTLIILDFLVETHLYLPKIKQYSNQQLLCITPNPNPDKSIIAPYYLYIKKKAKCYYNQPLQLIPRSSRQHFLTQSNLIQILTQVNNSFKIQNLILDINSQYHINTTSHHQLIHFIFQLLLKTYLTCHSLVTIAIKVLATRILEMNLYDLHYIHKFINYYNTQYTTNLRKFINDNRQLTYFENISIEQLLLSNGKLVQQFIESQLQSLKYKYQTTTQLLPLIEQINIDIKNIWQQNQVVNNEEHANGETEESETEAMPKLGKNPNATQNCNHGNQQN